MEKMINDLIIKIIKYRLDNLFNLFLVCKQWNKLINENEHFWKEISFMRWKTLKLLQNEFHISTLLSFTKYTLNLNSPIVFYDNDYDYKFAKLVKSSDTNILIFEKEENQLIKKYPILYDYEINEISTWKKFFIKRYSKENKLIRLINKINQINTNLLDVKQTNIIINQLRLLS